MERCPGWWERQASTAGASTACSSQLRPIAEFAPGPHAACAESFERTQHCDLETHSDGSRWRRCREVQRCWRRCHGRPPEEVSMSSVETLEPVLDPTAPQLQPGASGQPVSADAGRLFEEFFQFASELERSLYTSGALPQNAEQQKAKDNSSSSSEGSFLQRIFGKKPQTVQGSKQCKGDMDLFVQYASGPSQEI